LAHSLLRYPQLIRYLPLRHTPAAQQKSPLHAQGLLLHKAADIRRQERVDAM